MKRRKLKVGDRVTHEYLGAGTIERFLKNIYGDDFLAVVKFDVDPPVKFNMGQNPCGTFVHELVLWERT